MGKICTLVLAAAAAGAPAIATPYWIAWEADDWPENQGWTRDILGGGDVRTLEDGVMTLDGLDTGPGFVWDAYEWFRPGAMDPDPGETFVMQWRMRVEAVTEGNWDPVVFIYSDDAWGVSLSYATDKIWSSHEGPAAQVQYSPGVFHSYELRSPDMRSYEFFIDGLLVRSGAFSQRVTESWTGWGDGASVTRSVSTWDYMRVGVLPEPNSAGPALIVAMIAARVRRAW